MTATLVRNQVTEKPSQPESDGLRQVHVEVPPREPTTPPIIAISKAAPMMIIVVVNASFIFLFWSFFGSVSEVEKKNRVTRINIFFLFVLSGKPKPK